MKLIRCFMLLLCLTAGLTVCLAADAPATKSPAKSAAASKSVKVNAKDGATMVWVSAGEFTMGNDKNESFWQRPQHKVYLDGYWIYKNDVTVAQYRKFCQATKSTMPQQLAKSNDNYPVVNVTWKAAKAYAQWAGGALPTEAQWEKAARGTDERNFPWGGKGIVEHVGSYPSGASPYGCMDMAGNVMQYCADLFDANYYKFSPSHNPADTDRNLLLEQNKKSAMKQKDKDVGTTVVGRGASYKWQQPVTFSSTMRFSCIMTGSEDTGFRCVVNSPAP